MNNFLAILEYEHFTSSIKKKYKRKYKNHGNKFFGRTNFKYFMQTDLLQFCKDTVKASSRPLLNITTKSTHFLPAKKKKPILWIELPTNKIQRVPNPYI